MELLLLSLVYNIHFKEVFISKPDITTLSFIGVGLLKQRNVYDSQIKEIDPDLVFDMEPLLLLPARMQGTPCLLLKEAGPVSHGVYGARSSLLGAGVGSTLHGLSRCVRSSPLATTFSPKAWASRSLSPLAGA